MRDVESRAMVTEVDAKIFADRYDCRDKWTDVWKGGHDGNRWTHGWNQHYQDDNWTDAWRKRNPCGQVIHLSKQRTWTS